MTYYIIYKIENIINGKIYIGAHKTENINDSYMGSGKNIRNAIKKYGKENFKKEIIETFQTPEEMFLMESRLVNEDFVKNKDNYNILVGGLGSFDHINETYWTDEKRVEHGKKYGSIAGKSVSKEKRISSRKLIPIETRQSIGKQMGDVYGGQNKLSNDDVINRLRLIDGINMMEYGWVKKVSLILNLTHSQVRRFIKKHYNKEYYQRNKNG